MNLKKIYTFFARFVLENSNHFECKSALKREIRLIRVCACFYIDEYYGTLPHAEHIVTRQTDVICVLGNCCVFELVKHLRGAVRAIQNKNKVKFDAEVSCYSYINSYLDEHSK